MVSGRLRGGFAVPAGAAVLAVLAAWGAARVIAVLRHQPVSRFAWLFLATLAFLVMQQGLAYLERPRRVNREQGRALNELNVVVSIPVFNEDPAALRACITSLLHQVRLPQVIHVVDDGSDVDYKTVRVDMAVEALLRDVTLRWERKPNGGKRSAQALTFGTHPIADVFVTCDSDGILDSRALKELLKPLADPEVMSVAGIVHALNNRTTFLARITDLIWVTVQMTTRSAMSTLGSVLVNSGPLAAYRAEVIRGNLGGYTRETFMGNKVGFSDDSLLTLYAKVKGKTVQQPSAMVFCLMPDKLSHHLRQYLRWMRGSTIRSVWRVKYLPKTGIAYWMNLLTWFQFVLALLLFIVIVVINPLHYQASWQVIPWMFGVSILIGYLQGLRYLMYRRSDETTLQRVTTWLLSPVATLWAIFVLRHVRLYGMATCRRTGWGTRQAGVEVSL